MPPLTREQLALFEERSGRLEADTRPRWGRLDPRAMVRHLRRALEISMGEISVPDRSLPALRRVIWILFFRLFTIWPPSRRRLPEAWLPAAQESFPRERELLVQAMHRFVRRLEERPDRTAVHTILGP